MLLILPLRGIIDINATPPGLHSKQRFHNYHLTKCLLDIASIQFLHISWTIFFHAPYGDIFQSYYTRQIPSPFMHYLSFTSMQYTYDQTKGQDMAVQSYDLFHLQRCKFQSTLFFSLFLGICWLTFKLTKFYLPLILLSYFFNTILRWCVFHS